VTSNRAVPLTVLQGPAGLGKSLLLDEIARHAGSSRVTRINSDDELASYQRDVASSGRRPARLILIDNVDAADPAIADVLKHGRDHGAQVVVATRLPLVTVTSGMLLDGDAVVMGIEDLLFTPDEVATLATRHKADITPDDAADLHRTTDGWPAMVAAALRTHRPDMPLITRPVRELIDRFVREELIAAIPADELTMFTDAAAVPQIDASMLTTLLSDRAGADADPIQLIDHWATSGWIIRAPGTGHWRIPEPIRQYLMTDLDIRQPGRRVTLVTGAVQMLVANGRITDALPFLAEASLDDVVAGVLRENWGDDVVPHGKLLDAAPAVRSLSDSALANDPSLLLIAAVSALQSPPDTDTFALRLSQAESVVNREAFNGPLMTFHSLSMMLARIRGDIEQANDIERSGQAFIDAATTEQLHEHVNRIVFFTYQTGASRLAEGRVPEAEAAFRSARTMARNNRGDWYAALSDRSLAFTSLIQGDLTAARREIDSVRSYAYRQSDSLLIEHVNLTLGLLELEYGRTWKAPSLLSRAQKVLGHDAEPPAAVLAVAWSVLGLMTHDPGAAEKALLVCGPDYATNRLPFNRLLATVARAQAHLVQDDPKAALNELAAATALPGHAALFAITRARAHLAVDNVVAAQRELATSDEADSRLSLASRTEQLALAAECALRQGHDPLPSFQRLLALLERTGARRPVLLLPHLRDAIVAGELAAPATSPLAGLSVEIAALQRANRDGVPPLSDREAEVLAALTDTATLTDIAKRMYVSGNTLKTITRGLYRKLGAGDRHEAVAIARTLGISPPRGDIQDVDGLQR
jgi:ATP/maltotriose-dependent transcriptional regulator MalT